jgi:fucose 4-O-acetylase-like acetyltransferase
MRERINWIDWAKFLAITLVVMGHIPMEHGHPLIVYINSFHMPFFMFLSGYLTKRRYSFQENWEKDMTSIVLPYLLYNIVFYPYWATHEYFVGTPTTIVNYIIQPLIGIASCSIITNNVNGPTWFLVALLFSRITLDIGNRLHHKNLFFLFTAVLLLSLYEVNEFYVFTDRLVFIGFARCFPYFLIGYLLQNRISIEKSNQIYIRVVAIMTGIISISLSFFIYDISSFMLRILVQQIVCICAITFFTGISIMLNPIKSNVIINISVGTMVIFGLHWAFIGLFNQVFQHICGISKMEYSPWQVILLAIVIEAILYPLIKKLPPIWLGKKNNYIKRQLTY